MLTVPVLLGATAASASKFDAVYTAQDIGSYKPNLGELRVYCWIGLSKRGHPKPDILHTAQSLFHDHVPAKRCGLATCWIDRRHAQAGWGATMAPDKQPAVDFQFPTLLAMANAHGSE